MANNGYKLKKTFVSLLTVVVLWHTLIFFNLIDSAFFPPPILVIKNLIALFFEDNLLSQLLYSLKRLLIASLIAVPLAILIALLTTHDKKIDDSLNPIIAFTFPLPKVAIYPLLLLIFGIADWSKITLISIGIFYIIYINFRIAIRRLLDSQACEITKIYKLSRIDYFWNFIIKGCQVELLTGFKLGFNYGLTLVVVSETSTSNNGLGYFIWKSWDQFKIINVYSGIFMLSIIGFIFYYIFENLIERTRHKFF